VIALQELDQFPVPQTSPRNRLAADERPGHIAAKTREHRDEQERKRPSFGVAVLQSTTGGQRLSKQRHGIGQALAFFNAISDRQGEFDDLGGPL